MKKIEAVILPLNLNAVRMELQRRGIRCGLTVFAVQHSDSDERLFSTERGDFEPFRRRVKLELIVDDPEAEKVINIILRVARPEGDEEGGQITVLAVNEPCKSG
jgi:nitrogen regulatory protein PII